MNVVAGEIVTEQGVSVVVPVCYTGATTAILFETWFELFLLPELEVGSVMVMDDASFHRKKALTEIARNRGFPLLFLPPYSPDFNPIEKLWANMKRYLRTSLSLFTNLEQAIYSYL
jgi:transposase